MKRVFIAIMVLAVVTQCLPGILFAQEKADIPTLNNEAVQLSKAKEYVKAIEIWLDVIELAGPTHEYLWAFYQNVGRAFQKLSVYPEAWWYLKKSLELKPDNVKTTRWMTAVTEALARDFVSVLLESDVQGTRLIRKHGTRSQGYLLPLRWWFKPGEATLSVEADDHFPGSQVTVVSKDTRTVAVHLEPRARVGRLKLLVPHQEAMVSVDGKDLGKGDMDLELPVGPHDVIVKHPEFEEWAKAVTIKGGKTATENVALVPVAGQAVVVEKPVGITHAGSEAGGQVTVKTWVTLGSAVALGAVGGILFGVASGNAREQRQELSDDYKLDEGVVEADIPGIEEDWNARVDEHVKPYTTAAYVLWGVGGAALVAGGVMLVLDLRRPKGEVKIQALVPTYLPGGGGLCAQFSF